MEQWRGRLPGYSDVFSIDSLRRTDDNAAAHDVLHGQMTPMTFLRALPCSLSLEHLCGVTLAHLNDRLRAPMDPIAAIA